MKKILAILLCLLCCVSSVAVTASAGMFDDVMANITLGLGMEPDEPITYGITYDSNGLLTGIKLMYLPSPTIKFTNPGTYTVTDDIPLSVDYEFVCWEDEETGKLYYAGDKIYIDGQKTFLAVWKPKDDGRNRVIRTIVTAIETLRRTLQAFFGFYKVEYVEDPIEKVEDKDLFAIENLITYKYYYGIDKRVFYIAVKPVADGVIYESFSENTKIYFGGKVEKVEVQVEKTDENGNIYYEKEVREELRGAVEYSAFYEMTNEIDPRTNTQVIKVTLTDGVPNPQTGVFVTFAIPKGMLRYKDAEGTYKANKPYTFLIKTTNSIDPNEENHFSIDDLVVCGYDYESDNRSFKMMIEIVLDGFVYKKITAGELIVNVGGVDYVAKCTMTEDIYEKDGLKYQLIEAEFGDDVPENVPEADDDITITIPKDMITFKYTDGVYKNNKAYTFQVEK